MTFVAPSSFNVSDKRQRVVTVARARRPIDKVITTIAKTLDETQVETTISGPTFPATMTGLRWDLSFNAPPSANVAVFNWAIVYVRDGETIGGLDPFTNGGTLYNPEQNCLVWGYDTISHDASPLATQTKRHKGSTKTMRKLMVGDEIIFTALGTAIADIRLNGAVQLFLKG